MFYSYVVPLAIGALVLLLTFWVTQKAYSRKWDESDED